MAIDPKSISKIKVGSEDIPIDAVTVGGKTTEEIGELVTSIDEESTDSQYPSAKCVHDIIYGEDV